MTTIILVALGIILAAVAVLAVIFWGGSGFNEGKTKAEAGRLVAESVQMEHAVDMFQRVEGHDPGTLAEAGAGCSGDTTSGSAAAANNALVCKKYLTNVPPGASTNSGSVLASWNVDYPNHMIYSDLGTDDNATKICVMARKQLHLSNPETIPQCTPTLGENEPCCTK